MDLEQQHERSPSEGDGDYRDIAGDGARPRALPDDLPTSLDDRRTIPGFASETEMYDGWQGTYAMLQLWTVCSTIDISALS